MCREALDERILKSARWRLAVDSKASAENLEAAIDAVERAPRDTPGKSPQFIPIRFTFTNKLNRHDKLLLSFDVLLLSEALGRDVDFGNIIHGDDACYRSPPLGSGDLLAYLESQGFVIARHPYENPAHNNTPSAQKRKMLERIREETLRSYDQLTKPFLMQCSAGRDRSAPVAEYIYARRAP